MATATPRAAGSRAAAVLATPGSTRAVRSAAGSARVKHSSQDEYRVALNETLAQLRGSWSLVGPAVRIEMVIAALGTAEAAARLLGVSKSQPSRWRTGEERPSPDVERMLLDLDHVIGRAHLIFTPEVTMDWLTGSNSYLDGARPIDVLKQRGSTDVVEALDAAMQDAYS